MKHIGKFRMLGLKKNKAMSHVGYSLSRVEIYKLIISGSLHFLNVWFMDCYNSFIDCFCLKLRPDMTSVIYYGCIIFLFLFHIELKCWE